MKTVEETKKTKEDQVELKNEVKENTANTPEGAIPDDAAEAVAGGFTIKEYYMRKIDVVKTADEKKR